MIIIAKAIWFHTERGPFCTTACHGEDASLAGELDVLSPFPAAPHYCCWPFMSLQQNDGKWLFSSLILGTKVLPFEIKMYCGCELPEITKAVFFHWLTDNKSSMFGRLKQKQQEMFCSDISNLLQLNIGMCTHITSNHPSIWQILRRVKTIR